MTIEQKTLAKKLVWAAIVLVVTAGLIFGGVRIAASYYYNEGVKQYESGDYFAARHSLESSLRLNSRRPETHFYFGRIALGRVNLDGPVTYPDANYSEAIFHYEKAITLGLERKNSEFYSRAVNDTGLAYWILRDYDKADANFLEHVRVSPSLAFLSRQFLAADYFGRLSKPQEALDVLLPAIGNARTPDQAKNLFRVYARLSQIYQYFDDFDAVERYARLAIENGGEGNKTRNIQIAHNSLALALGKKSDFAGAEREIEKSKALADPSLAYDCVLAHAYALGGAYIKAVTVAKSVLKPVTNSFSYFPVCLRTLAEAYQERNNPTEAKKYMEEYLSYTGPLRNKNILMNKIRERFMKALGS